MTRLEVVVNITFIMKDVSLFSFTWKLLLIDLFEFSSSYTYDHVMKRRSC